MGAIYYNENEYIALYQLFQNREHQNNLFEPESGWQVNYLRQSQWCKQNDLKQLCFISSDNPLEPEWKKIARILKQIENHICD